MNVYLKRILVGVLGLLFGVGLHLMLSVYGDRPVQAQTSPPAMVQIAKEHHDQGQFAESVRLLRDVEQIYAEQGDRLRQAQTLGLMSLSLQQLGQWDEAREAIAQSLALLDAEGLPSPDAARIRAQVMTAYGHLDLMMGRAEAALSHWEAAEQLYAETSVPQGVLGSRINQTRALQSLGLHRQASRLLGDVRDDILNQADSALKIKGILNLGNLLRLQGNMIEAREMLLTGLAIAQDLQSPQDISQILLSLGTTERILAKQAEALREDQNAQAHFAAARSYYDQAAAIAPTPVLQSQARLNQLSLLIDSNRSGEAQPLIPQITRALDQQSISRSEVYARVNFGKSLIALAERNVEWVSSDIIRQTLETAIQHADRLADPRAKSYALGTMAMLYEQQQNWQAAKDYTRSALSVAYEINAADIFYQWQWQMGRVVQAEYEAETGDKAARKEALDYYSAAVTSLDRLRSDLVALNPDVQFSFRETVEPIYRQLVDLLLRSAAEAPTDAETISETETGQTQQELLIQARDVIEGLQLAELDNFFRDACAQPNLANIDTLDPSAAVFYPIILGDRLEVIVRLPGSGRLVRHSNPGVTDAQINRTATNLSNTLKRKIVSRGELIATSQDIYDWLIHPFEEELELAAEYDQSAVKTLVFVLDGALRNLPMGAIFDGEHYLLERYAVAVAPGLQLVDPKTIQRDALRILLAGVTDGPSFNRENLSRLDNVSRELEQIAAVVPNSTLLTNQNFLKEAVQDRLNSIDFNAVHIATHGKFSSNPEQTFILDWNKRIQAREMNDLLSIDNPQKAQENPIELLTLSACETATGDDRAALGLAGLSIRAGVRSTLATLWQVDDASTAEIMIRFYQQLSNPEVTKAEALRNAQLDYLEYLPNATYRPYYWAPLILVGNWL